MDRMKTGTRNAASANLFDLTSLAKTRGISPIFFKSKPSTLYLASLRVAGSPARSAGFLYGNVAWYMLDGQ